MEILLSIAVGVLVSSGLYLMLRARMFPVVLGLTLLSYGVNVFLFASGRVTGGSAPLLKVLPPPYTDPLPQALVLTAIVIGFGMTAFLLVLALRALGELGNDHVDGVEPPPFEPVRTRSAVEEDGERERT
jgi:multicomponent K+:H+ antiporter subunit C